MSPPAIGIHSSPSSSIPHSNDNATSDHQPQQEEGSNSTVFGFATEFDTRSSRARPVGSTRPRPRLAKVKKQLHGRSRAVSGQFGSGFNPFKSVSENSCNFGNSSDASDGFLDKCVSNESVSKLNSDMSFTFGAQKECLKSESVGFVFGTKQNERNCVLTAVNGKLDDVGFAFRANVSGTEVNLDSEKDASMCGLCSGSAFAGNVNSAPEVDCEKNGNVGFKFGVDGGKLGILNLETGETNGSILKPESGNFGFVSGAAHNDVNANAGVAGSSLFSSTSSFNNEKIDVGGASMNSVSDYTSRVKIESETDIHKVKETKIETEINGSVLQKECSDEGLFVFGRNSKQNASFFDCVISNHANEVKSVSEAFETCNGVAKSDSTITDKCKHENSCNADSTSSAHLVCSLQDEIKKLNINDYKNADGADKKKSEMGNASFEFRSSDGASASSNGNSETIYEGQNKGHADCMNKTDVSNRLKSSDIGSADTFTGISSSESFTFQAGTDRISVEGQVSQGQVNDCMPPSGGVLDANPQEEFNTSEAPPMSEFRKENDECSCRSTPESLGVSFSDLKPPKWDPSSLKASLFLDLDKKLEFSAKSKLKRDKRSKTMRGNLKKALPKKEQKEHCHVDTESSAQDFQNSPGCYSPMDFSPYEESTATEELSREFSGTSNNPAHQDSNHVASVLHPTSEVGIKDEATLNISKEKEKPGVPNDDSCRSHCGTFSIGGYHSKEYVFGAEIPSSDFKTEQVFHQSGAGVAAASSKFDSNRGTQFFFDSGLEEKDGQKFSFSASSSSQDSFSMRKRLSRKKNKRKVPSVSFTFAPGPNVKDQEGDLFTSKGNVGHEFEANGTANQCSTSSTMTVQDVCETWRLRGNHAYKSGDMTKAEDFYTRGINSVPSDGMLKCCLKPLVICYSNRAATRMSLGNMREALSDCRRAATLDPDFLKVQMRAANCHLVLGELENAMHLFNKCLESGPVVCLDRRITIEAADGLRKAQKVAECKNCAVKLLENKTSEAALSALEVIAEALSISPYSERLLELKAEATFMLRKYEEVIQLCEDTLSAAGKFFPTVGTGDRVEDNVGSNGQSYSLAKLWRWRLVSKSYFYLGKLEVALDLIEKLEQIASISDKHVENIFESSVSLAVTIRDLLCHKNAGNEAVKSGRYLEAVEHYTAAVTSNIESRPFTAICFCNRAAAHQALGQIADAIADCSLAMALERNYSKAVSRRATLHEMIRDYGQAASDLGRLISNLKNQSNNKAGQSDTPSRSTSVLKELRLARRRLSLMEEEAKKGIPLDMYLILGVKRCDTATDIKKAYRKAALRHHPDKAGQFLPRSESGAEGKLLKEIFEEVHMDADRLFKMIGEAYAVLSDNTKRTEYDQDEEIRKESKKNSGYSPQRRTSAAYSHPFDRPDHRRQDYWKTYGYSRSRW